jgi:hypothetical protein
MVGKYIIVIIEAIYGTVILGRGVYHQKCDYDFWREHRIRNILVAYYLHFINIFSSEEP